MRVSHKMRKQRVSVCIQVGKSALSEMRTNCNDRENFKSEKSRREGTPVPKLLPNAQKP
jgi:hypothetical protein